MNKAISKEEAQRTGVKVTTKYWSEGAYIYWDNILARWVDEASDLYLEASFYPDFADKQMFLFEEPPQKEGAPYSEHSEDSVDLSKVVNKTIDAPHSSHYAGKGVTSADGTRVATEPWHLIESMGFGEHFCAASAIKYLARFDKKGTPVADIEKSLWYTQELLRLLKEKENN